MGEETKKKAEAAAAQVEQLSKQVTELKSALHQRSLSDEATISTKGISIQEEAAFYEKATINEAVFGPVEHALKKCLEDVDEYRQLYLAAVKGLQCTRRWPTTTTRIPRLSTL